MDSLLAGLREFAWQLAALCFFAWVALTFGAMALAALIQWFAIRKAGLPWR